MSPQEFNSSGVPPSAFTLHGGCSCGAIKITIQAPADSERTRFAKAEDTRGQGDLTSPIVVTDHCNDCRKATASLLPVWIVVPLTIIEFSLQVKEKIPDAQNHEQQEEQMGHVHIHSDEYSTATAQASRRKTLGAKDVMLPSSATGDTYLGYWNSSENTWRYFCSRCGTQFGYYMSAPPPWWEPSLDMLVAALERESLERVRPSRQLWWDRGVQWVQELSVQGVGDLSKHPGPKVGVCVGDM